MDTDEKVPNVVLDAPGLKTSRSAGTISSVELALGHVPLGRDAVSAFSQEVTVLCPLVVRAKDSPGTSEVTSNVLLPVVEEVEASTEIGPRVDGVPMAGDFPAVFVSWDRGEYPLCLCLSMLLWPG